MGEELVKRRKSEKFRAEMNHGNKHRYRNAYNYRNNYGYETFGTNSNSLGTSYDSLSRYDSSFPYESDTWTTRSRLDDRIEGNTNQR